MIKNQNPKKSRMMTLKTSSTIFKQVNKTLTQKIHKTYNQSKLNNRQNKVTKFIQILKTQYNNQMILKKNQYPS